MTDARGAMAARMVADAERARLAAIDGTLSHWNRAAAGAPVPVHTIDGTPSYWLVPIESNSEPRKHDGFVRVSLEGRVMAAGSFGGRTQVVTGITQEEAREKAASAGSFKAIAPPLFVHDGPPGREGWRVDVTLPDGTTRVLFVTRGGVSVPRSFGATDNDSVE